MPQLKAPIAEFSWMTRVPKPKTTHFISRFRLIEKNWTKVVLNHEEQDSIWPADRENPLGWRDAGKSGIKAIVAAAVELRKDDNGRTVAGRLRLCRIPNVMGGTLVKFVSGTAEPGPVVRTDGWARATTGSWRRRGGRSAC